MKFCYRVVRIDYVLYFSGEPEKVGDSVEKEQ
jgi:hypothetical protein